MWGVSVYCATCLIPGFMWYCNIVMVVNINTEECKACVNHVMDYLIILMFLFFIPWKWLKFKVKKSIPYLKKKTSLKLCLIEYILFLLNLKTATKIWIWKLLKSVSYGNFDILIYISILTHFVSHWIKFFTIIYWCGGGSIYCSCCLISSFMQYCSMWD